MNKEELEKLKENLMSLDIKYYKDIINYISKIQKENEELEKTLKQTQNSWFGATNLIDRQQKELEQEKEINKYLENENKKIKKDLNNALNYSKEFTINKEELKKIVDECIPKKENMFTGELEYSTNANANSFLAQAILDLLKEN